MLMGTEAFRELDRLRQTVSGLQGRPAAMPMTAYREDGAFVVHIDLPGLSPETIDATVERNVVTVRAERSSPVPEGAERFLDERPYGIFSRQLVLDDTLAVDDVTASYDAGVLTLRIPIVERAKPRRVEITGTEEVDELTA